MSYKQPSEHENQLLNQLRHNPHDAVFKFIFSKIYNAKEFLEKSLPFDLLQSIDLNYLKAEPGSFIDKELTNSQSDLLFSCSVDKKKETYVYFLWEHKSYFDPKTPRCIFRRSWTPIPVEGGHPR